MNTNINFSFARLMAVMKLDLIENWRTNLHRVVGLYCGITCFLIGVMSGTTRGSNSLSGETLYNTFCSKTSSMLPMILFIYIIVYASKIMEIMNTKEKRLNYMMLPATIGEKFISRVIYITIITGIFMVITFILGDITRIALLPLFNVPDEFYRFCLIDIIPETFSTYHVNPELFNDSNYNPELIINFLGVSHILWVQSVYVLGGSYFRKSPFLKTFGICIGITILIGCILASIITSEAILDILNWLKDIICNNTCVIGISLAVILLTFSIFNWWLSYRLFKKSQITEKKYLYYEV